MKTLSIILIFSFSILNFAFSQQTQTLTKEEVIGLYKSLYLTSDVDSIVWNGNVKNCECGTLSDEIYLKVVNRINFFRLVNGLNPIKMNSNFNQEAQDAALLIKANEMLTHYPTEDMKCYSQSAYNGSSKSCLGFTDYENFPETSFLTEFLWDYGDANYYVGHRKWILYSKLKEIGYGATNRSEVLLVVDGVSYDSINLPEYTSYPWKGYVPVDLIFPKWSFSIPQDKVVDFSNCSITMTDEKGTIIELEKLEEYKNYLDHTIVWQVTGLFSDYDIEYGLNKMAENGYLGKKITVKIKKVFVDGKEKNFEYSVEPIKI
jgi:hypothetical protein